MVEEYNKTIIITTHYIEEASQANFVCSCCDINNILNLLNHVKYIY